LENRNERFRKSKVINDKSHRILRGSKRANLLKKEYSPNTQTSPETINGLGMHSRNHKLQSIFSKGPSNVHPLFFYKQKVVQPASQNFTSKLNVAYRGSHDYVKALENNPTVFRKTKGMCSELAKYSIRTQ